MPLGIFQRMKNFSHVGKMKVGKYRNVEVLGKDYFWGSIKCECCGFQFEWLGDTEEHFNRWVQGHFGRFEGKKLCFPCCRLQGYSWIEYEKDKQGWREWRKQKEGANNE